SSSDSICATIVSRRSIASSNVGSFLTRTAILTVLLSRGRTSASGSDRRPGTHRRAERLFAELRSRERPRESPPRATGLGSGPPFSPLRRTGGPTGRLRGTRRHSRGREWPAARGRRVSRRESGCDRRDDRAPAWFALPGAPSRGSQSRVGAAARRLAETLPEIAAPSPDAPRNARVVARAQ